MSTVRITEHPGPARIFAKRATASKWAKLANGKVMKIGYIGFVVYVNGSGWVK